jgi:hypothetical protein
MEMGMEEGFAYKEFLMDWFQILSGGSNTTFCIRLNCLTLYTYLNGENGFM